MRIALNLRVFRGEFGKLGTGLTTATFARTTAEIAFEMSRPAVGWHGGSCPIVPHRFGGGGAGVKSYGRSTAAAGFRGTMRQSVLWKGLNFNTKEEKRATKHTKKVRGFDACGS
ncbi:MAG: hypothetical protein P4L90_23970 [Rhodopila sp.]|nr:hypothetical protein [Rhodopila sp.]